VDQPLVAHVPQQPLERDLVLPPEPERLRDLALAGGPVGRLDEVQNLLAGGQARKAASLHHSPPCEPRAAEASDRDPNPRRPGAILRAREGTWPREGPGSPRALMRRDEARDRLG